MAEDGFEVTAVTFEDLPGPNDRGEVVRVEIEVEGLVERAIPYGGAVGDVELRIAARLPLSGTVIGFLPARPASGGHVLFGYVDGGFVDTGFVYEPGEV